MIQDAHEVGCSFFVAVAAGDCSAVVAGLAEVLVSGVGGAVGAGVSSMVVEVSSSGIGEGDSSWAKTELTNSSAIKLGSDVINFI